VLRYRDGGNGTMKSIMTLIIAEKKISTAYWKVSILKYLKFYQISEQKDHHNQHQLIGH